MSHNVPFVFAAGGGQHPPVQPPHQALIQHPPAPRAQVPPTVAQQNTLQQNGLIPGIDLSALEGISPHQLAAIARLFQSGALLPLPPEASVPPTTTVSHATHPQGTGIAVPQRAHAPPQEQDVDMDVDEGEIEEFEPDNATSQRGFLHPPPTGPRSSNANHRGAQMNQGKPSPRPLVPTQSTSGRHNSLSKRSEEHGMFPDTSSSVHSAKDIPAKAFVLQMLKAGWSFEDLVKETGHPQPMVRLFTQLHLEVPAEYAPPKQSQSNGDLDTKSLLKRAPPAKPPAPPKPIDRNEYLARLQAAKNKKVDATTTPVAAAPEHDQKAAVSLALGRESVKTSLANGDKNKADSKAQDKDAKNALLQKRLEELKAKQAARQSAALSSATIAAKPSSESQSIRPLPTAGNHGTLASQQISGLGAGLESIATKASQLSSTEHSQFPSAVTSQPQATLPTQSIISAPPPTPTRSLSGLPGLFMFGQTSQAQPVASYQQTLPSPAPTQQQNVLHSSSNGVVAQASSHTLAPTPTAPITGINVPRKRPVASDFDYPTTKPKRPFGLSRGNSVEDSVIITISDDEDDDADDEMDTDNADPPKSIGLTSSFRDAAPLRDFPPRTGFPVQVSGQSTPGGSTPGGTTYEQRIRDIEEMKRKIAEAEKRKFANGKVSILQKNEVSTKTNRSDAPSPNPKPSGSPAEAAAQIDGAFAERPVSATALTRLKEKERLRQRLQELEQGGFKGMNEAVAVPTSRMEVDAAPVVQETQVPNKVTQVTIELASEAGEISDDSEVNFYDETDAQGVPAAEPAKEEEYDFGSQSSTASAVSNLDESPKLDQSSAMKETLQSHPMLESPVETPLLETTQEDLELEEIVPDSLAPSEPVVEAEGELDDDDSDSMSEDSDTSANEAGDSQDLDKLPFDRQSADSAVKQTTSFATDADLGDGSDSMESSADSEDYEPPSPVPMEVMAEAEDQVGKIVAPAAAAGPSTAERTTKDDVVDEDLAPALQPPAEQHPEVANEASSPAKAHFKPYESALRGFKDFKWHPDFLNTTSQGFQSPTFSHKIDANQPLCPFEGAGGQCNDPTCQYQHFKDMGLTDNELLKLLGTHNAPAHSQADQKRWNEGLGTVIKQLRLANASRDVNAIAAAIAEFRRRFVGDATKVLNLG